jgi:acetyltransferase-like isoleucine patch superfamily enzyme|tara:strand:+ start:259 stop:747 length:489 start_codon:yes stop_codon:yes gene_type:complete
LRIINESSTKKLVDVQVGKNVIINDFVNVYGCTIDDGTKIGPFVEIQNNVYIGKNCKISSHTFICEGVNIKNGVFVGHNVSFINDKFPFAVNQDFSLKNNSDWELMKTVVNDKVSIGTSSTILGGIQIGENSIIGAGSVVTKDVPANVIVAGNPAKILRQLD